MLIRSLKLKNFGKFSGKQIDLQDGINIIYGDNEAGKSTIHTFIKGMLFGINKNRGRATKEDSYLRYLPWQNPSLYQGSMDIDISEKKYRIYRNFHKDYKELRVLDLATGRELPVAEDNAVVLLYLNETNYKNTISIAQKKADTEKDLISEVQNYIANLSTSKDSEVNVGNALAFLQSKKKLIETNGTKQRIDELILNIKNCEDEKLEIDRLTERLTVLDKRIHMLDDMMSQKLSLEESISTLQIELSKVDTLDQERFEADTIEYEELLQREKELYQEFRTDSKDIGLKNTTGTSAINSSKRNASNMDSSDMDSSNIFNPMNDSASPKKINLTIFAIPIILTVLAIMINPIKHELLWILLLIWGAFGVGYLLFHQLRNNMGDDEELDEEEDFEDNKKRDNEELYYKNLSYLHRNIIDRKDKILNYYKVKNYEELKAIQTLLKEKDQNNLTLLKEYQIKNRQLDDINCKAEELCIIIFTESKSKNNEQNTNDQSLLQKLHYASQCDRLQNEKLKWQLEQLEQKQDRIYEDQKTLERLKQQLTDEDMELRSLQLASKTIEELSIKIHDSFGVSLSKAVTDIMKRITNNRYSDVKIDEKLNIKVLYEDDYIPLESLSAGTVEQVYLALRLEISRLFYEGENLPFILDDCFAYYDDKRLKKTLETLSSSANQIIIFTCHKRESELLDELGVPYHFIKLAEA